ncbi:MAG: YHS domain-containing (seleno)protein [Nitrospiraceae bacterium]
MTMANRFLLAIMVLVASMVSASAFAEEFSHSTPGISGYDPVAYFSDGKPMRGSGYHVTVVEGVTYAFATAEHQKMFETNPEKYLPAYGGYCAYGLGVGKKFVADPEVWRIVEGKLYLNLDKGIQQKWEEDISGFIKKGNANWITMKEKKPSDL